MASALTARVPLVERPEAAEARGAMATALTGAGRSADTRNVAVPVAVGRAEAATRSVCGPGTGSRRAETALRASVRRRKTAIRMAQSPCGPATTTRTFRKM